jgi:Sulfotransferase family
MTDPSPAVSPLAAALDYLGGLDPKIVGATGGSGTRVVGRIVRAGGMYIGTNLNDYQDALDLGGYSDRWIDEFVRDGGLGGLSDEVRAEMVDDLAAVLQTHRRDRPSDARAWGWKEPRSIYLLPFFDAVMPEVRFLHWLRDGRDMAFSENQQQLKKHGDTVLSGDDAKGKQPLRSIRLWSKVNTTAADFGEQHMPGRYLRIRFEDLCAQPAETVARIYEFFGLEGDVEQAAAEVRPPDSLGRWQKQRRKTVDQLHELASPALERFGYL